MTTARLKNVLGQVRTLLDGPSAEGPTDRQLLDRFLARRDEAAFAEIVRRHGGLVLGLCRRMLPQKHDAEDAFQAAFLVLAEKAASIRKRDSLRCWLYGVAYRIARKLRADLARRAAVELRPEDVPQPDTTAEAAWRELRPVLDEELNRLPQRYRLPLLLCYLEGRTRDEAAEQLGWGLGVLRGRLERGRLLLRARLARRGLTLASALPAALLATEGTSAAVSEGLLRAAVQGALSRGAETGAAGVIPAAVASLAAGTLRSMAMSKWLNLVGWALALGLLGAGVVGFACQTSGEGAPGRDAVASQPPAGPKAQEDRGMAELRRRVNASDRIVVGKFALQTQDEPVDPKVVVTDALKGPLYSGEASGLQVTGVKHPLKIDYQTTYVIFLRSVENEAARTTVSPAVPEGWFVPATAQTLEKVRAAIPPPREWGKGADGLRLGLRLRQGRVKLGEDVIAEVSLRNVSGKKLQVAQHRMTIYDYWPETRFHVKAPNGREHVLEKPTGPMEEFDLAFPLTLEPGATYTHAVRLNRWPVSRPPVKGLAANLFVEPGGYQVSCTYVPTLPRGRAELVKLYAPPAKVELLKDGLGEARLRGARANLKSFHVWFTVHPDEPRGKMDRRYQLRSVSLDVPRTLREPESRWPDGAPMGAAARITEAEAGQIVDILRARANFFERAQTPLANPPGWKPNTVTFSASHGGTNPPTQYALTLPLDPDAIRLLREIRNGLKGEAGKLLDRFLAPIVEFRGKAARLRPHRFTEGGGYEWRGVFELTPAGAKPMLYLCDPQDRRVRILVAPNWAQYVLKEWERFRGKVVEGRSLRDEEPLDFRSLVVTREEAPLPPNKRP
jgi:RNA polymerase sigma factor (sigma-70 family)